VTFSNYFLTEAKIRDVPESTVRQANKIADAYLKTVDTLTPSTFNRLKKRGLGTGWAEFFDENKDTVWFVIELTSVRLKDLETNKLVTYRTFAGFGENNKNYAICNTDERFIMLYDDNCRDLPREKLVSSIVHEIVHGFQQHKTYSKKYVKSRARSMYHKEPIEFDAFTAEIAHTIQTEHQKLKNNVINAKLPETKKLMERKLEKFLLELKMFIQSPLNTYFVYKELPLPTSMETFDEMLKSIHEDPKLWKSFKTKLLDLYSKLS
jgi:hypothetical protein